MQTRILSSRLKKIVAAAALLALVAAPLALAAQSGALKPRSDYEDASRAFDNALPPPDRAIHFRGECAYEEHVRVNDEGWTLIEHVMRCVEKIAPRPCVVAAGEPQPTTTTARSSERVSSSPRPCPAPEVKVHFALAGPDGRYREIDDGGSIPLAKELTLVARSRTPAALHFVATRNGETVAEWDGKVGPENAFKLAVRRLVELDATELAVRAEFSNGAGAGYHFRLVTPEAGAPPQPASAEPAHPERAEPTAASPSNAPDANGTE